MLRQARLPSLKDSLTVKDAAAFLGRTSLLALILIHSATVGATDLEGPLKEARRAIVHIVAFDGDGKEISEGAGFFITRDGSLVTSSALLAGASKVQVILSGAGPFEATSKDFLIRDQSTNLTLLSVGADNVPYLKLANPADLDRDSEIMIAGVSGDSSVYLTDGRIKAIRLVEGMRYRTFLSDPPIASGAGGGPILNMKGEVVGVVCERSQGGQRYLFGIESGALLGLIDSINQPPGVFLEEVNSDSFPAGYISAVLHYYAGDHEKASQLIDRFIETVPNYAAAYELLGSIYYDDRKYIKELETYDRATQIFPKEASFYFLKGTALESLGRDKEAIAAYRRALELDPANPDALWNLAFLLVLERNFPEARKVSAQLQPLNPKYSAQLNTFMGMLEDGRKRRAGWLFWKRKEP